MPRSLLVFLLLMNLPACSRHFAQSPIEAPIAPCGSSPNCVSSNSSDQKHAIDPLPFHDDDGPAWPRVRALVLALPRTKIVAEGEHYLHAECRSPLGFVDDLELQLRPNDQTIAVRSAARSGYYDFGVNRRRVEMLRARLREK